MLQSPPTVVAVKGNELVKSPAVSKTNGTADAYKLLCLNKDGQIDPTLLGESTMKQTIQLTAAVDLVKGELVNAYLDGTVWKARKATASDANKYAVGFVADETVESGAAVNIQTGGLFEAVSNLNTLYLRQEPGTAGAYDDTAVIRQVVGRRVGDNAFLFISSDIVIIN